MEEVLKDCIAREMASVTSTTHGFDRG